MTTAAERVSGEREGGRCRRCGQTGVTHHHRKKRRHPGADAVPNIVMLCGSGTTGCHGLAHGSNTQARLTAEGYVVPSWADPVLFPIWSQVEEVWLYLLEDGTIRYTNLLPAPAVL